MDHFTRFGLYIVPQGSLYSAGTAWLGWDCVAGTACPQPDLPGVDLARITETPRKYGFHGTIKPPFALAEGQDIDGLVGAARDICADEAPVVVKALSVRQLGRFIALIPGAPSPALKDLAGRVVSQLDRFRRPPTEAELTRRRAKRLTQRQEFLLQEWGYPYVMDQFRFHMTLTGPVPEPEAVCAAAALHFAKDVLEDFCVDSLALMGEASTGSFHLIDRFKLSGTV